MDYDSCSKICWPDSVSARAFRRGKAEGRWSILKVRPIFCALVPFGIRNATCSSGRQSWWRLDSQTHKLSSPSWKLSLYQFAVLLSWRPPAWAGPALPTLASICQLICLEILLISHHFVSWCTRPHDSSSSVHTLPISERKLGIAMLHKICKGNLYRPLLSFLFRRICLFLCFQEANQLSTTPWPHSISFY